MFESKDERLGRGVLKDMERRGARGEKTCEEGERWWVDAPGMDLPTRASRGSLGGGGGLNRQDPS